jgi:ferredoxin--NADP+ reductase
MLYLLSTGTGLAPFLSIIRDPETYERFERVVLVHGCRHVSDLAYRDWLTKELTDDEFLGEMIREKLVYYPTVTREPFENRGRITDLITSERLFRDVGASTFDRASDRVMLCGSPAMLADLRALLQGRGYVEGNHGESGDFVIEKAFVEK